MKVILRAYWALAMICDSAMVLNRARRQVKGRGMMRPMKVMTVVAGGGRWVIG